MTNIDELFEAAKKDNTLKDHWFKEVQPTFYPRKTSESARLEFNNALFNFGNAYSHERTKLAQAYLARYDQRKRQTNRLVAGIAGIAIGLAAYFLPVDKPDAVKAAAGALGIASMAASAYYAAKIRE